MSKRYLRAAVGLILLGLALPVFLVRGTATRVARTPTATVYPERPAELAAVELAAIDTGSPARSSSQAEAGDLGPDVGDPQAEPLADPLPVAGWVLENKGEGLAGASVLIRGRQGSAFSGRATTDSSGHFALQLDGGEWESGELANVHVSVEGGGRLFSGVVTLGTQISILLARPMLLAGRLVNLPPGGSELLSMRFDVPGIGRFSSNLFVGKMQLDSGGAFALLARPVVESTTLLLTFFMGTRPLGRTRVSLEELTSSGGADVDLGLGWIRLAIKDVEGSPLEGVMVGAMPLAPESEMPRLTEVSGVDGLVELLLPNSSVELCASKVGFSTKIWELDGSGIDGTDAEKIVLSQLSGERFLKGIVELGDGSPVAGAGVSAYPLSRTSVGFGARSSARTSEDGTFSISISLSHDRSIGVIATHVQYGRSSETSIHSSSQDARIRFEPRGTLVLELESSPTEIVARSGPIECLLVNRKHEYMFRDHIWGSPSPLLGIPEGDYNLYVFWSGMDVFGASPVTITAGETTRCRTILLPARWLRGDVVNSRGRPIKDASIQWHTGSSVLSSTHSWSNTTSASDGSFRLLLGWNPAHADLRVRSPKGNIIRWNGERGPAHIVLPGG